MFYFCTTKKKISTVALVILLSAVLLFSAFLKYSNASALESAGVVADTLDKRVAFLKSLGFTVDDSFPEEQKQVEIPFVFSDVYKKYNNLQEQAGYDLYPYSGKEVTLYTLRLSYPKRDDVYAGLLIYEGKIIGGDVTARNVETGFIIPLRSVEE